MFFKSKISCWLLTFECMKNNWEVSIMKFCFFSDFDHCADGSKVHESLRWVWLSVELFELRWIFRCDGKPDCEDNHADEQSCKDIKLD